MSAEQLHGLMKLMECDPSLQSDFQQSGQDPMRWAEDKGFAVTREDIELEDYRRQCLGGQSAIPWSLFADFCW